MRHAVSDWARRAAGLCVVALAAAGTLKFTANQVSKQSVCLMRDSTLPAIHVPGNHCEGASCLGPAYASVGSGSGTFADHALGANFTIFSPFCRSLHSRWVVEAANPRPLWHATAGNPVLVSFLRNGAVAPAVCAMVLWPQPFKAARAPPSLTETGVVAQLVWFQARERQSWAMTSRL